jgi:glycosyltransferase involved in cell wall biosynthesis
MKIQILYVGNFKLPDKNAAAQRVFANSKIFVKLGFEVVLVGVSDEIDTGIFWHPQEWDNIQMISIPYPKTTIDWIEFYSSNRNIYKIINEFKNIKYFIGYNYQSLSFFKLYFKFSKKIIFISDVTEWYQPNDKSLILRTIKIIDSAVRMRIVNKYVTDGNIVISRFLENFYKKKKVIRLPPLVDLDEEKWKPTTELDSGKIKFIFFGTAGEKKEEIELILKFYNNVELYNDNSVLNIFGLTQDELLNIDKYNKRKIIAHGRVSHRRALNEVSNSHFSIFFRKKNLVTTAGFPTKFVESMSAGTPVITNYTSDLKEYIRDGQNGIVVNIEKLNVNDFNEIESLKFYIKEINHMKKKSFDTAVRSFNYKNYLEIMEVFLNEIDN